MKTLFLIVFLCIVSCATVKYSSSARPTGPRTITKTRATPKDVPTIRLAQDNVPDFWTARPTIIDTNSFADQHQLQNPIPGIHPRPAKFLPPHQKPDFDMVGPPNELRSGFGNTSTLIHDEGSFDAIANTSWNPPDPSLAVGPNHVVVTVNTAIAFYGQRRQRTVFCKPRQ